MGELVDFDGRMQELIREGRRVGITGGGAKPIQDGHGVQINAPVGTRGAALLVHKERTPEWDDELRPICTKCRVSRDIVLVIGFPGGDGDPLQFCRTCVDRPSGKPLVVQFRS